MKWEGNRQSDNVEDARGSGGGRSGIRLGGGRGVGIGSIVIALLAGWIFGINPLTVLGILGGGGGPGLSPAGPAGAGDASAGRRCDGGLRLHRAGRHRGRLERPVQAGWRRLRGAEAAAVSRQRADGLRPGRCRDGAVLLPGRPQGLHRPRFLRHHGAAHGRAGRFRAGLCDRARGRPPRAEPAGDHRQGRRDAPAASPKPSRTP